jgi:amino acid permease
MLTSNLRLQVAFFIYIILVGLLILLKPRYLFNKHGKLKHFGTGSGNKTVFPFWLLIFLFAILAYYIGFMVEQILS